VINRHRVYAAIATLLTFARQILQQPTVTVVNISTALIGRKRVLGPAIDRQGIYAAVTAAVLLQ
jgi:hypothetical protein